MKKTKIFAKVVYYLFTFVLGVILAIVLPYTYASEMPFQLADEYLIAGNYAQAINLTAAFYDKNPVFVQKFDDGGGIVLFATTTLYNGNSEHPDWMDKMHGSYSGYIFGVKDRYEVHSPKDNKTELLVETATATKRMRILNLDIDGDKNPDSISSMLTTSDFIYLDFDRDNFDSLRKLTFVDKTGAVFKEIDLKLDFEESIFADVSDFQAEYNSDFNSDKLDDLSNKFLAKSENYAICVTDIIHKAAMNKAVTVVLIYFICIYIIADFLVGRHYIIRFFKWLFVKVFKVKSKKPKPDDKEIFGNDYYSQVTMSLDLSELPDFNQSVQVRYADTESEAQFTLLKENGYSQTKRIKAGVYPNPWIDLNREYAPVNLPDNLVVEGYKMEIKIKIISRKD
ncbi:MAG: hypothetical protein NC350_00355 [Corallococcus sp.]|nr:hypothetical protein [Corallococcus sp.]